MKLPYFFAYFMFPRDYLIKPLLNILCARNYNNEQ